MKIAGDEYISENYFRNFIDKYELFFVAEYKGKVIGYILGEPMKGKLANIGLLAVDRKFRGQGIGKKLLETFRIKCDEKGLTYLVLYAPKFNKKSLKFYRNMGFKEGKKYIQFVEKRV